MARLATQATEKKNCALPHIHQGRYLTKTGRYPTCITSKTKPNEIKPIKVIDTAINSKLMNIVRVQKAQGTETTPTLLCYNINVVIAMLY